MTYQISVISSQYLEDGSVMFRLRKTDTETGTFEEIPNCYRADDPYSGKVGEILAAWIAVNQSSITPYEPPAPLTPEEIRAQMPNLTARQFWMAAANIDIDKDVIVAAIKAAMPDGVDRKMMIAELESGSFERLNPTIIDVMAILDIPAYQVDDLWVWAAGL